MTTKELNVVETFIKDIDKLRRVIDQAAHDISKITDRMEKFIDNAEIDDGK